jgi:hypothetical protein
MSNSRGSGTRGTSYDPFQLTVELDTPWEELASSLDEMTFLSSSLVTELTKVGAMLPWRPPTSHAWIFRLQLGLIQANAISLSAAIGLLRDFHRGVVDDLPIPS